MNAKGYTIVRRLTTDQNSTSAFWPEHVVACTQLVDEGWGSYLQILVQHVAQMGLRLVNLLGEDKEPNSIPLSDWNAGAYITMYQAAATLPCKPGVAPPLPDDVDVIVLDETSVVTDDGRVGYEVVAYRPRPDDRMPGGTRLPMTEVERVALEIGRFRVMIQNAPGQQTVWASGCFDDETDEAAQAVIEKIRKAAL